MPSSLLKFIIVALSAHVVYTTYISSTPTVSASCTLHVLANPSFETDCTFHASTRTVTEYTDCGGCVLETQRLGAGVACQTVTTVPGAAKETIKACGRRGRHSGLGTGMARETMGGS
ncbi:hypothetical protein EJ02DRAFT_466736 [Clathrospora elynae]|uniref:Uncharacterized protein n=1 Tax=Clathrospora elynae TaxID=706981 RepID=A0A6A5SKY2_9PLEO|nr:hypothetical protein EJ02DRAFT_466736 [Clathrospora elynae]